MNEHNINPEKRVSWSDSKTVICWLRSESRYRQFVGFRIGKILELSKLTEWRWLPSGQNVPDEATKWNVLPSFDPANRWFSGP